MNVNSPYKEAHLMVAAVRILEYRHQSPPTLEQAAGMLCVSIEEAGRLCRKLVSMGIIETLEKSDEIRLFIGNHRLIEQIPDKAEKNQLSAELEKFRRQKKAERKTIDELRSRQEAKRKKIKEQIQHQLKSQMSKDNKS